MKKVLFIFFTIIGFNVQSQKIDDLITFSDNIDGIDISISTPNSYEIIENPNDVPDLEAEQKQPTDQDMAPNPDETIGDVVGPENVGVQGLSKMGERDWDSFKLSQNYEIAE